jgi:hypothetical protein
VLGRGLTIFAAVWLGVVAPASSAHSQGDAEGDRPICCFGGAEGELTPTPTGGVSAVSGRRPAVASWVTGVPGGGVRPPRSTTRSQCTRWRPATDIRPTEDPTSVGSVRVDPDGITAVLYFRDCGDAPIRQYVWVRREPPAVVAQQALSDLATRLLTAPEVAVSPPDRGVVNLETWLAAIDTGPISATATIPGLSVTATATIASTTWDLGNGDRVTCPGTGVTWSDVLGDTPAPCGYTYRAATAADAPHRVTATFVWQITWQSSQGDSGTLPDVTSTPHSIDYPVREVQTVGVRG